MSSPSHSVAVEMGSPARVRESSTVKMDDAALEKAICQVLGTRDLSNLDPRALPHTALTKLGLLMRQHDQLEDRSTLCFQQLRYRLHGRAVLQSVSGFLKPGMLVGCIGPADSGTSTLLRVLAGRHRGGTVQGTILVNGSPPGGSFSKLIGYVPGEETHFARQKVKEALAFSLQLRHRRPTQKLFLQVNMMMTLGLLRLDHRADSLIGDENVRGISGGEKRRLTIGVEVLAGHSIMLVDKATNGLDSTSALEIVTAAKHITRSGMAIMMSVVQPAPELFHTFDYVCLMSKGTTVYFGPTSDALPYFLMLGYKKPQSKGEPDFIAEILDDPAKFYSGMSPDRDNRFLSSVMRKETREILLKDFDDGVSKKKDPSAELQPLQGGSVAQLSRSYRFSIFNDLVGARLWHDDSFQPRIAEDYQECDSLYKRFRKMHPRYNSSFREELYLCMVREFTLLLRDPSLTFGKLGRIIFMSILFGTVFYKLGLDDNASNAKLGLIFTCLGFFGMGATETIPDLFRARDVFHVQKNSGYYRPLSYYLSKVLSTLPISLIEVLVYSSILYPLCGLHNGFASNQFFVFVLCLFQIKITCASWAMFLSSILKDSQITQAVATATLVLFFLMSGYLIAVDDIPTGWKWINTISMYTLPFKVLATNEFGSLKLECPPNRLCPTTGVELLDSFGLLDDGQLYDTKALLLLHLIFFLIFFAMGYLSLSLFNHEPVNDDIGVAAQAPTTQEKAQRRTDHMAIWKNLEEKLTKEESKPLDTKPIDKDSIVNGETHKAVPVVLKFKDLFYTVTRPASKHGEKPVQTKLLNKVHGYARRGMLVALMGPSGAGKSTLLDVLAERKTTGKTQGLIHLNGLDRDRYFARRIGYVEQFNSLSPYETVREALETSARMRVAPSHEAMTRMVDRVLKELRLESVQDQAILNISDEMKKKVSIGIEVITDPGLLFLDEPTTGLDSSSAHGVATIMRALSESIPVVCTIHQPSAEVFEMFNYILLLRKGGDQVYFGPAHQLLQYCKTAGMPEPKPDQSLADYALEVVCSSEAKADYAEAFSKSILFDDMQSQIGRKDDDEDAANNAPKLTSRYALSWLQQVSVLFRRMFIAKFRDRQGLTISLLIYLILGLIVGTLYFDLEPTFESLRDRLASMFVGVILVSFLQSALMEMVITRRPVYYRELSACMYGEGAEFIADTVSDIPYSIVKVLLFGVPFYWCVGLSSNFFDFLVFMGALFISAETGAGHCRALAYLASTAELASVLQPATMSVFMLFSGFLIVRSTVPKFWLFLYYGSYFRYGIYFLTTSQLEALGDELVCTKGTTTISPDQCRASFFDQFSMNPDDSTLYLGIMIACLVAFRIFCLIIVKNVKHISR